MDQVVGTDVAVGVEDAIDARFWHQAVLERFRGQCASCGSEHKVTPRLVVAEHLGGKKTLANSTLWCRACEMVANTVPSKDKEDRRIVNIWVSSSLHERLQQSKELGRIESIGALVRQLISSYVKDTSRFDDLAQYQDTGSDVRLNVWVEHDLYRVFKETVDTQGLTVTSALKSLFCLYENETSPRFDAAKKE